MPDQPNQPPKLPAPAIFMHGRIPEALSDDTRKWLVEQLHRYPDRVDERYTCAIGALTDMATTEFCRLMHEKEHGGYLPEPIIDWDPQPATELAPGVTLFTRDGSKIGNAIVIRALHGKDSQHWLIETDYGNQCTFSEREIDDWFTLGVKSNHDMWWDNRLYRIHKGVK